ncbi:hypothetical protein A9Q89_03405 [Gammaproteobacteria bacterium 53_120_T64]|nr:hypothetical protein A9Q89_03405 [Gammaproteobacteria bacterium 53_120_T64]
MSFLNTFRPAHKKGEENSLIANFRLNFEMYFGLLTLLVISPFVINHFLQHRFTMAALTCLIVLLAACNSMSIYRHQEKSLSFGYFFALILITLSLGLFLQGPDIIYWCYPFALIVLSIAEHRQARVMLALSLMVFLPTSFYALDTSVAARFLTAYFMVCLFGDIVVKLLDQAQEQQTHLAITDPLTGAYNRRSFLPRLEDAAESCRRGIGSASLIAIDIDHFKKINDTLGHHAGDKALKALVDTLLWRKRKLDAIFRTGGEEFFVLAHDIEPGESIAFADGLRMAVQEATLLQGQTLTISVGVADYSKGQSIDGWIQQADINLYEAKRRGRNRVWPPYFKPTAVHSMKLMPPSQG